LILRSEKGGSNWAKRNLKRGPRGAGKKKVASKSSEKCWGWGQKVCIARPKRWGKKMLPESV